MPTSQLPLKSSTVLQHAIVRRISPNLGLALELPTEPSPRAGFAHVSNILDNKSDKLEKVCPLSPSDIGCFLCMKQCLVAPGGSHKKRGEPQSCAASAWECFSLACLLSTC